MFHYFHNLDCHSLQTQRLGQISSSGSHFTGEKQKHRLHSSVPQAGQAALPARGGGLGLHQCHLLTGNTFLEGLNESIEDFVNISFILVYDWMGDMNHEFWLGKLSYKEMTCKWFRVRVMVHLHLFLMPSFFHNTHIFNVFILPYWNEWIITFSIHFWDMYSLKAVHIFCSMHIRGVMSAKLKI